MSKRIFWKIFKQAWEASFTERNIKRAFEKTGIWPFQPSITVKQIQKQPSKLSTPTRLPALPLATPVTARGCRRVLKLSPSRTKEAILERAVMRLVTQLDSVGNQLN